MEECKFRKVLLLGCEGRGRTNQAIKMLVKEED
jgi:hypothetical protein